MKKIKKITLSLMIIFLVCASVLFCLSGCSGDNTTVNVGIYKSTDACSLYFTGLVNNYYSSADPYTYFSDNINTTLEKINNAEMKRSCVLSYVRASEIDDVFATNLGKCSIVLIDNLTTTGEINGVWIARNDWMTGNESKTIYKKMLKGLLRAMDYRAENYDMTLTEALDSLKNGYNAEQIGIAEHEEDQPKYIDNVMQYIAIYSKENNSDITETPCQVFNATSFYTISTDFTNKTGSGYTKLQNMYQTAYGTVPTDEQLAELIDFTMAEDLKQDIESPAPSTGKKKLSALNIVLIAVVCLVVVLTIVFSAIALSKYIRKKKGLITEEKNDKLSVEETTKVEESSKPDSSEDTNKVE